jgi:hypothetical protein
LIGFAEECDAYDHQQCSATLFEDAPLAAPILAAEHICVLVSEPPDPWTVALYELRE